MQRFIEIGLIATIIVGSIWLWRTTVQRDELQREHDRLAAKIGVLAIKDPAQVHIRAIATGEPLNFAWRAYFPANYRWSYTTKSGSGGSSSSSSPQETILRVRIREIDGHLMLYTRFSGGSGLMSIGPAKMLEMLKQNPEALKNLQVERLAADGPIAFDADQAQTLVKISLPAELQAEAKEKLQAWEYERVAPTIEWIRFGPPGFAEREQAAGQLPK
jgi:hypothetical protein